MQPCFKPASSELVAGLEMLSKKEGKKKIWEELFSLCDGEHKARE